MNAWGRAPGREPGRKRGNPLDRGAASTVSVASTGLPRPAWSASLARYCRKAMAAIGAPGWDVSVLICDDAMIAALNKRYRGRQAPTDVLSFRQDDGEGPAAGRAVGDIVISFPTVSRNAAGRGVPAGEELARVTVHALLHLAGMDHGRGRGGKMLALQEELVGRLGRVGVRSSRPGRLGKGRARP